MYVAADRRGHRVSAETGRGGLLTNTYEIKVTQVMNLGYFFEKI